MFGQGKVRSILYVAQRGEAGYTGALIDLESEDVLFFPGASDTGPINFADGKIAFEIKSVEMHFEGTVSPSGDEIKGKFTEGEISGNVIFTRDTASSALMAEEYTSQEFMIPMRDGIHLHTTVFSPKNRSEALPFLIERSPYGMGLDEATWHINAGYADLARDGYFFVFQDIRGRYQSEGQSVYHRPARSSRGTASKEIDEGTDTYDTIEWLVNNVSGNNGRAGILGISYGGWLTEMALVEPHPALKAASEQASPADWFLGDDFHHNGAFRLSYG
ncbi:MAG: CocE/NonD family hydrolase, partial [Candidatus Sulfotelmatobacter sp.]